MTTASSQGQDANRPLQRSHSEVFTPLEQSEAPTNPASSSLRRLSRRFTMSQIKPVLTSLSHDPAPRQSDEARKTEQFERMMDRFQLRLVTHPPRTLSSHSQASLRHGSVCSPPRNQGDAVAPVLSPTDASEPTPIDQSRNLWDPWPPAGTVSLVRTVVITLFALVHLVFSPMRLAYGHIDPSIGTYAARLNVVVDVSFLVNVVLLCNTATHTARGQLVTTRRAIWRQYRRDGLFLDIFACLPLELLSAHITWWYSLCLLGRLVVRLNVARRQQSRLLLVWANAKTGSDLKWLDWFLYSRFGHLVRIGRLLLRVCLLTHFMACVWTHLCLDDGHVMRDSVLALHLHSVYDVLQLLQGQGIDTTTVAQDVFASCVVLLGSIFLAVMFGHVAILIANFNANDTAYQRKIESVFAIMDKLQLPQAIRDRVHQYYGYLHTEYESLDGEVVKFAKDLSHTLELEVVLYKYMDVVMNVPHWIDCSPDFQKQLVLNVTIRVYMPDDIVIRRGEVGTSCFIVNRGICKHYQLPGSNDDVPTVPLHLDSYHEATRGRRPSDLKYLLRDGLPSLDSARLSDIRPIFLTRGHAIGERALIDNYVRTTDVRAFTYVEMCVLEREPFQRILTRYPEDCEMVLTSIVRQWVYQQGTESPVMATVRRVVPDATIDNAVAFVVDTMTPDLRDPTILFGGTDRLEARLRRRVGTTTRTTEDRMKQLEVQLNRMERTLETLVGRDTPAPPPQALVGSSSAHAAVVVAPTIIVPVAAGTRQWQSRRRGSDSVLQAPLPVDTTAHTHTLYTDRLFQSHMRRIARPARPPDEQPFAP